MRHGRAKAGRKTLSFFARTAGIKAPYHILLDGTFLVAIVKYKFPVRERLDKMLQHDYFTMYTTKSVLEELEALKEPAQGEKKTLLEESLEFAQNECSLIEDIPEFDTETKDWLQYKYPAFEETLSAPGMDILKLALLSKPGDRTTKYFVACHDEDLLDILRRVGSVPCVRLARGSVLLLENPSKAGQRQATHDERKKWAASGSVRAEEKHLVEVVRAEKRSQQQNNSSSNNTNRIPQGQTRTKRKAKEPNPLSCKKSKGSNEESTKKRRRRRTGGSAAAEGN